MAEAELLVRFAGPHVSIQDAGRPGWARFGVPASGAMDRFAMTAANISLGNPANAPVIEVSRGGLQLDCLSGATSFALAGGGFILEHAEERRGSWSRGFLRAGERLTIRPGPWGNWCCLAFVGQLGSPDPAGWLGSLATHMPSGFGGGRLFPGSRLHIANTRAQSGRASSIPCPIFARPRPILRATTGPQEQYFAPAALSDFYRSPWRVTSAADRMGTRLAGPVIAPLKPLDMASEPLTRGSVQVAGDGVATLLTADHQTTGGYPRIATVLDCDLAGFAQLSPGQRFIFKSESGETAVTIARSYHAATVRYLERLAHQALRD